MSELDLVLRTAAVTVYLVLGVLFARAPNDRDRTWAGTGLCLSLGAFMVTSAPVASGALGVWHLPLTALCATHPVWFWIFCGALFRDTFRFRTPHAVALVTMAAAGTWFETSGLPYAAGTTAIGLGYGLAALGFAVLGPVEVGFGWRTDLDDRRRLIRGVFLPIAATYLGFVILIRSVAVLAPGTLPPVLPVINVAVLLCWATAAIVYLADVRFAPTRLLADPERDRMALSRQERVVLARLEKQLLPDRLYAREGLTVPRLAALLDTQEHVLRRVINRGLGFRNFNDFLHTHRLREAAARLADPAERRLPILTIALEAGYGSIGPFNRAFKARFEVTPSAYRRGERSVAVSEPTAIGRSPATDRAG